MPRTDPIQNGGSDIKRACPYCDVVFILAILLAVAALVLSMLQGVYAVWALVVFVVTLSNCFFQAKTKKSGLIAAGLVECAYGLFCVVDLLNMESNCDGGYLPCNILFLSITAGLWLLSGSMILYFVFSGRVKNFIKEGLEIEAVATPLGSVEDDLDALEMGHESNNDDSDDEHDSVASGSDHGSHRSSQDDASHSDQDSQTPEPAAVAVSATICEIPDLEGVPEEIKEKLAQSMGVPFTPARPLSLEESERSTVSYLPTGHRDWDASNRSWDASNRSSRA